MNILSVDLGGTNSRFGHFIFEGKFLPLIYSRFEFKTGQKNIRSFEDLILFFEKNKPESFLNIPKYDFVVFSVAGLVRNRQSVLPNVGWNIDLRGDKYKNCFLINDFVAQSYGIFVPEILSGLRKINNKEPDKKSTIALVGAGTGLGHCAIIPDPGRPGKLIAVPSEAGHSTSAFIGKEEKLFEDFLLQKLNITYCINETVVSGKGLSLICEYLTGLSLNPKEITSNPKKFKEALDIFSVFYARACRNYCLSVFSGGGLIITGGIAAKNPYLITSGLFKEEFFTSENYSDFLKSIPILINLKENIGVLGGANYIYNKIRDNKKITGDILLNT